MATYPFTIIGDRINPGFKNTKALLEKEDLEGIQKLAVRQALAGASYLDVTIGARGASDPVFLRAVIEAIQAAVDLPLCFDYPSIEVQETCLKCYDIERAQGRKPIVNSISEPRWAMVELLRIRPFKVMVMASERLENGAGRPNKLSSQVVSVAKRLSTELVHDRDVPPDDIIIDVSVSALSSDTEGLTKMAIDSVRMIHNDPGMKAMHITGGLTNIGQLLPAKTPDGADLRNLIERSFLTLTVPHGFDTVLGTPWKDYSLLPEDNPVLLAFKEIVQLKGLDAIRRLRKLYRG